MKPQFLRSANDRYGGGSGTNEKGNDKSLFWWTMLNIVLLGIACLSWFFSIYVFSHPEKPFNYQLLTKLDKLDPLKRFDSFSVPSGDGGFQNPQAIYARYAPSRLGKSHLGVMNGLLKRRYLLNYSEEKPVYVTGQFKIEQIRMLEEGDPISRGFVLRGVATDYTALDIEYIVPSEKALSEVPFQIGDTFRVEGSSHYASVVHVTHLPEERVAVSLISLVYPKVGGEKAVAQTPPSRMNLTARWPLTDGSVGSGDIKRAVPVADEKPAGDEPEIRKAAEVVAR